MNQNPIDHICNICSKKFSTKKILTKHGKLHNKSMCDTPISAASCVVCKKTLVNIWNMERHTKKDHGLTEKGNVIENSAGIVKEKLSETRAKRLLHQCEGCQYSSIQKANLRRHIQSKHDGRTKPDMRGRKTKTGPVSDRTTQEKFRKVPSAPSAPLPWSTGSRIQLVDLSSLLLISAVHGPLAE